MLRLARALLCATAFVSTTLDRRTHGRPDAPRDRETADADAKNHDDSTCGPRCVERILHYYGHRADLMELVREIQWPALEAGSSLEAVGAALEKRGIHTAAVRISARDEFVWPWPAVIYREAKGASCVGHFVVRLPSRHSPRELIWDEVHGERIMALSEFNGGGPLLALLTSDQPIRDGFAVARPAASVRVALVLVLGTSLSAVVAGAQFVTGGRGGAKVVRCVSQKGMKNG